MNQKKATYVPHCSSPVPLMMGKIAKHISFSPPSPKYHLFEAFSESL